MLKVLPFIGLLTFLISSFCLHLQSHEYSQQSNIFYLEHNIFQHTKQQYFHQKKYNGNLNLIGILGPPGSGKSTQCEYLNKTFGFQVISTGDLFRNEVQNKGPLAKTIQDSMKQGKLLPSSIVIKLLISQLKKIKKGRTVLLDGFPRNKQNLQEWNKMVGNRLKVRNYLIFDCPFQVTVQRLLKRGQTSGRQDDNIETIRKRFQTFEEQTQQVIDEIVKCKQCDYVRVDTSVSLQDLKNKVTKIFKDKGYKKII